MRPYYKTHCLAAFSSEEGGVGCLILEIDLMFAGGTNRAAPIPYISRERCPAEAAAKAGAAPLCGRWPYS